MLHFSHFTKCSHIMSHSDDSSHMCQATRTGHSRAAAQVGSWIHLLCRIVVAIMIGLVIAYAAHCFQPGNPLFRDFSSFSLSHQSKKKSPFLGDFVRCPCAVVAFNKSKLCCMFGPGFPFPFGPFFCSLHKSFAVKRFRADTT